MHELAFPELSEQVPVATELSGGDTHSHDWRPDRNEIAIKLSGTMGPWDIEDLCKEPYQEFDERGKPKTLNGATEAAAEFPSLYSDEEYKDGKKHPPLGLHCRPEKTGEAKELEGATEAATAAEETDNEYIDGKKHPPLGLHCRAADVDGDRWFYISTKKYDEDGEKKRPLQPQPEPEPEPELHGYGTTYMYPPQPEPEPELESTMAVASVVQRSSRYAPLQREHLGDTMPAAAAAMPAHVT